MKRHELGTLIALAAAMTAGCATVHEDTSYNPAIDPARFTSTVDNPYFPLVRGKTYTFRNTGGDEDEAVVVTVTNSTRVVMGVTCVVVHDVATVNGKLREDTWDWYAQDRDGNVWYFGEDTKAYEKGRVDTEGSWEAGVKGAKPGICMAAHPKVGDSYRQEYLAGEAEDMSDVVAIGETVTVAAGTFTNCVKTKDYSPLEADVIENKYFAPGVGVVLSVQVQGGHEHEELVSIK